MSQLIEMTGMRFERLAVLGRAEKRTPTEKPRWNCVCDFCPMTEFARYKTK